MKIKIILIFVILIQTINTIPVELNNKPIKLVLFDKIFFRGMHSDLINHKNKKRIFKILFFNIGKHLSIRIQQNECVNFPDEWLNKTTSVLTNKCIALYSDRDCKTDKSPQIFQSDSELYEVHNSAPDNIPNYSFYGTWYDFY
jgi:hypothetical protein